MEDMVTVGGKPRMLRRDAERGSSRQGWYHPPLGSLSVPLTMAPRRVLPVGGPAPAPAAATTPCMVFKPITLAL